MADEQTNQGGEDYQPPVGSVAVFGKQVNLKSLRNYLQWLIKEKSKVSRLVSALEIAQGLRPPRVWKRRKPQGEPQ